MRTPPNQPRAPRKGLTLVELLVTIALMLLVMTIIVGTFQSATSSMTIAQTDQELASVTRRLDAVLRQDLQGATARFTPPLDPADGLGYFEYGENSFADAQGEDIDDYVAFTAKAPPGQPFLGRIMLQQGLWTAAPRAGQPRYVPTVITSEYAEIIYFLRHGNLYRRILLIAPDRDLSLSYDANVGDGFDLNGDGTIDVSWQGASDISVRPAKTGTLVPPIPNTLGDLTNRENRAFRPRFANDYQVTGTGAVGADGTTDDVNLNGVPDWYPTLYPGLFSTTLLNDPGRTVPAALTTVAADVMPFPYLFPGSYSVSGPGATPFTRAGGIHMGPYVRPDDSAPAGWVLNHGPLDLGDNIFLPAVPPAQPLVATPLSTTTADNWTFWGFPTWRETRSSFWNHATKRPNDTTSATTLRQGYGMTRTVGTELLSPLTHWYTDGAGNSTFGASIAFGLPEEDLIATNVRSFDVKALDPNSSLYSVMIGGNTTPQYVDLGYAMQFKPAGSLVTHDGELTQTTAVGEAPSFGHEGRIPPFTADNRVDPQWPNQVWTTTPWAPNNIGDNATGVVRLRRVWDSWSTTYTRAPATPINPFQGAPFARPTYPSYPPPYPSPLLGLRIQIRLYDQPETGGTPRAKQLTITQDFTEKL